MPLKLYDLDGNLNLKGGNLHRFISQFPVSAQTMRQYFGNAGGVPLSDVFFLTHIK